MTHHYQRLGPSTIKFLPPACRMQETGATDLLTGGHALDAPEKRPVMFS